MTQGVTEPEQRRRVRRMPQPQGLEMRDRRQEAAELVSDDAAEQLRVRIVRRLRTETLRGELRRIGNASLAQRGLDLLCQRFNE